MGLILCVRNMATFKTYYKTAIAPTELLTALSCQQRLLPSELQLAQAVQRARVWL